MYETTRSNTLQREIEQLINDPLRFVLFAFAWGEGELRAFTGPDAWQRAVLSDIREALLQGAGRNAALRMAVASGHGIGKSALVAWVLLWAMLCPDTRGVVTANTEAQLKGKTWAELSKWHRLCVFRDVWDCTATALIAKMPGHEKTWRVDMVAWSERSTEAFAGLHNKGRRVLLVFDEASAIPDVIWDVSEGALTDADTQILWCAFGNPTRNTGRFRECFGRFRHRWNVRQVDSRTAAMTNKEQLQAWVDDYGEDSDFVRVRVRGEFPKAGSTQFIASDLVEAACGKHLTPAMYSHAPLVMGVDVARFGTDDSVITLRQGLYCEEQISIHGMDCMQVAARVAELAHKRSPSMIFIDGVGIGAGVVDRVRALGFTVTDAQSGARAINPALHVNKRAEMWDAMREWLASGAAIPPCSRLKDDLTGLEYGFDAKNALQLEKKDDLKKRGLSSPDRADSLALTFYAQVLVPRNLARHHASTEYDVLNYGMAGQHPGGYGVGRQEVNDGW